LVTNISNAHHAYSQRYINNNGEINFCYREERDKSYNSQRKPARYAFAGYIGFKAVSLLKYGNIWGERSLPIIGGPECSIDIDTKEDLEYAEFILRRREK
jgi:CMP-N-acetylneuraminic acid synthetase